MYNSTVRKKESWGKKLEGIFIVLLYIWKTEYNLKIVFQFLESFVIFSITDK